MSIFLIDPLKQSINQPKTGYDIHAVGGAPTNTNSNEYLVLDLFPKSLGFYHL